MWACLYLRRAALTVAGAVASPHKKPGPAVKLLTSKGSVACRCSSMRKTLFLDDPDFFGVIFVACLC